MTAPADQLRAVLLAHRATIDAALALLEADARPAGEWLTVRQAAARLGKTEHTVRAMAKAGTLDSRTSEGGGKIWVRV